MFSKRTSNVRQCSQPLVYSLNSIIVLMITNFQQLFTKEDSFGTIDHILDKLFRKWFRSFWPKIITRFNKLL